MIWYVIFDNSDECSLFHGSHFVNYFIMLLFHLSKKDSKIEAKTNYPIYLFTDTTLAAKSSPRFTPSIWRWLSMLSQFTTLFGSAKKPNYPISVTWRWSSNQNAIFEAIINSFILKTRRFKKQPPKKYWYSHQIKKEIGLQIFLNQYLSLTRMEKTNNLWYWIFK